MAWFASKMFKICMEDRDASIKNPVCLVGVFHKHNLCNPDSDLDSLDYLDSWNAILPKSESKVKK